MEEGNWPKPSMDMIELLESHMSRYETEKKKMFGFPCFFVNGNMFTGVFADTIFARFSIKDRDMLERKGLGTVFEPVSGRKMSEYRVLSRSLLDDSSSFDDWLDKSYSYVSSLRQREKKD